MPRNFKIGVLARSTIRAFENRKRRDVSFYKTLSEDELEDRMLKLPQRPPIWRKLSLDQRAFLLLAIKYGKFGIFADTGVGKTLFSIAAMRYFIEVEGQRRFIVLVPNRSNCYEWRDEFAKHAPAMKITVLDGSTEAKWDMVNLNLDADAVVTTYAGFMHMVCTKQADKRRAAKGNKQRLVPHRKTMDEVVSLFDGVFADESTYLGGQGSLPWRLARFLSKHLEIFFPLTGTPFNRDPEMLWAQLYLVDFGEALGETMQLFKQTFYTQTKNWFGTKWSFDKSKMDQLNLFLNHSSITVEADEADLPPVTPLTLKAALEDDALALIEQAKAAIRKSGGNKREMANSFLRMRQISSGFVGFRDDDSGDKVNYWLSKNPKLERLEQYLTGLDLTKGKVIIYHDFNPSAGKLSELLNKLKIPHALINGMRKDTEQERARFNKDPKCKVLVLSNSAGGFGLNLQVARWGIYYESPVSAIIRKQTQRRFIRQYSQHANVFLVDLITKGCPADEAILAFHREARNLWAGVLKISNVGEGKK